MSDEFADDLNVAEGLSAVYTLERLGIAAYVFKSKSPSCGWKNVQKFNRSGRCLSASGQGIFAALVKRRFPNIPVIEETDFPELLDMMD